MLFRQSKMAPQTWSLFMLPLLTLVFPLAMLLVVLQRLPAEEIQLASTDARLLQPVSTFWCSAQEVSSSHPFYVYKVPKAPPVLKESPHLYTLAFRFNLLHGKHYLLRYHLLAGSTLELAGCTNKGSAPFEVVYGREDWMKCLKVISGKQKPQDDSSEESDSQSESDETYVQSQVLNNSISHFKYQPLLQDYQSKRGGKKLRCGNSVLFGQLELSPTEVELSPSCPLRHFPFALTAGRTGKYYILVHTDGSTEPGAVLLHVRLNRTIYELPENVMFCPGPSSCSIPLTFGAEERVVVFVSPEPDAGSVLFPVRCKCQPRVAFYLVVFLLLPVIFGLALLYIMRFHRRRVTAHTAIALQESLEPEARSCIADSAQETELNSNDSEFSKPPSYREVVQDKSDSSQAPPSYEELLGQPLVSVHRL